MKNIKIILSAVIVLLLSSCQDAIDIKQPGELAPADAFTSVDDLQKGLYGVYGSMSVMSQVSFNSIFTDEVRIGYANGGQGLNDGTYGFLLNINSNDAFAIWQGSYSLINVANRLIAGAANVHVKTNSQDDILKRNILSQAYVLRAWGHFVLASYFSQDLQDNNALCCIKMDHVPTLNEHLPRNTNSEIFAFIDSDLKSFATIQDYFTSGGVSSTILSYNQSVYNGTNNYITADFVNAFKARMYAYRGLYTAALPNGDNFKTILDNLIAAHPINSATQTGRTLYKNIWKDIKQSDEVIAKLTHIYGDAKMGNIWASVDATISGSPFFTMSSDLYQLLKDPNDVRNASFIDIGSDPSYNAGGKGKIAISKYPGQGSPLQYALLNDEKVFRTSEMYFLRAEWYVANGDLTSAQADLQAINNSRFKVVAPALPPQIPTFATAQDAWREILKQRRIELCYEGHRYMDLKRLAGGLPSKLFGGYANLGSTAINRASTDCAINQACTLSADDYRLIAMPIPNDEIQPNTAIKAQGNNKGY